MEWPTSAFGPADDIFAVVILGDDPLDGSVENAFRSEKMAERPIVVSRIAHAEAGRKCQMLYVGDSEAKHLEEILRESEQKQILTVASFAGFAERGGVIQVMAKDGKVGFAINNRSARRAGLKISSKLLSLAQFVITDWVRWARSGRVPNRPHRRRSAAAIPARTSVRQAGSGTGALRRHEGCRAV